MTFVIVLFKALVEIVLMLLIGQAIVGIFAGHSRLQNPVYRIFQIATQPVVKVTRMITPRAIIDAHVPFVTFLLGLFLWLCLTVGKIYFVRVLPVA